MVSVLAFNMTVIAYMIGLGLFGPTVDMSAFWARLGVGVAIGTVVGAVAFVGAILFQR